MNIEETTKALEIILLVIGSSGLGGLALGIYNAIIASRKGTIEEWRGLLAEQRSLIDEQKKKIDALEEDVAERDKRIIEANNMIYDLKDWAERLVKQFSIIAPGVEPERFIESTRK